jgi:hypothetical protein
MRKLILFTAITVCPFVACREQQSPVGEAIVINVDITQAEEWGDISGMLQDSVEIIPLQTTDKSLIAEVSDTRIVGGKVFVTDKQTGRILAFDRKGNFLRQIGRMGRGPNEYFDLTASEVTDEHVLVFDKLSQRLYFYRHDGSFVNAKDVSDVWAMDIAEVNDKLYFINAGSNTDRGYFRLFELDRKGDYIASALPFSEEMSNLGWGMERHYSKNGDRLMFYDAPYDSLFVMKGTRLDELYYVDFGPRKAPESVIKIGYNALRVILERGYIAGVDAVHFTDNFIIISFLEKRPYIAIYDKATGECKVAARHFDPRFPGLGYGLKFVTVRDNTLIWPIGALAIKRRVSEDVEYTDDNRTKNEFQLKMIELASSLDELDNPVLFVQKFK